VPVRRRVNRHSVAAADFAVTPEIRVAFEAYIASDEPADGPWPEHWEIHDRLLEAGALELPWVSPCCWHPRVRVRWEVLPGAVAVWRRLYRTKT